MNLEIAEKAGFALMVVIEVVQFAAIGLCFFIFSNRQDRHEAKMLGALEQYHAELKSVSPLFAMERVSVLGENLNRAWAQIASLTRTTGQLEEDTRQLAAKLESLERNLGNKVDSLGREMLAALKEAKSPPRAKPGEVPLT